MKTKLKLFVVMSVVFAFSVSASAAKWEIDLEAGAVLPGYNDVRIPNETGTLFSLADDLSIDSKEFFRGRLSVTFSERHTISLLVAPLTLDAAGVLPKDVNFQGVLFPAGNDAEGVYRFDSYRLTYRYTLVQNEDLSFGIGFTAKIRDAEITLKGAGLESQKLNTGFVPLLNLHLVWHWSEHLGLLAEADALASGYGRAEDVGIFLMYKFSDNMRLKAGYRLVEGGADVDEVYNFAFLSYLAAGLQINF